MSRKPVDQESVIRGMCRVSSVILIIIKNDSLPL